MKNKKVSIVASVLLGGALLLASPLGGPVVAHVNDSLDHLTSHLDERYVRSKVVTKRAMCPGFNFYPHASGITYNNNSSLRTGGPGTFRCGVDLPAGGTITRFQVAAMDSNEGGHVGPCNLSLVRVDAVGDADVGLVGVISDMNGTSDLGTPGAVELKDDSINPSYASINNQHAYWVECGLNLNASNLGLYGAFVTYQIERGA
jgi:hypothetical protein